MPVGPRPSRSVTVRIASNLSIAAPAPKSDADPLPTFPPQCAAGEEFDAKSENHPTRVTRPSNVVSYRKKICPEGAVGCSHGLRCALHRVATHARAPPGRRFAPAKGSRLSCSRSAVSGRAGEAPLRRRLTSRPRFANFDDECGPSVARRCRRGRCGSRRGGVREGRNGGRRAGSVTDHLNRPPGRFKGKIGAGNRRKRPDFGRHFRPGR